MNLLRCHILGFGRLSGISLTFARGLNIICAPNEAGKSTLQRFLMALLYGQLRSDIKTQRRLDPWVEAYSPWRAPEYGGVLWCELANGREIEIHRMFGRDDSRIEIRTISGEDITRQYEAQRNGDVIFAAAHMGLAKDLFESVAVIRESETAELKHRDMLRDRIANLAQSGDEKLSVRLSLVKLEEALESIGSERAPTRPYKQALDRLQELQSEREELETQRRQCQAWIQEKLQLGNAIRQLEQDLHSAARGTVDARWREARLRVRTLEEIDGDLRNIEKEIGALGANPEFPVHRLDDLNRLAADRDNLERRLEELRRQKEEVSEQKRLLESELQKLAPYAALHSSLEPEKVTEWFVNFLSLSRQKDDAQRNLNQLLDEAAVLMRWLDVLSPVLQEPGVDWERKARQAAEEERTASQQSMALAEKAGRGKDEYVRLAGKAKREGAIAVLILLAALTAGAAALGAGMPLPAAWLGAAAVLGLLGLGFMMAASRSKGAAKQAKELYEVLEDGLQRSRDQVHTVQSELDQAVKEAGFQAVEEFLAAAREAVLNRQRLEDLAPRIRAVEQQRDGIQAEADAAYAQLREWLTKAGLSCAPGNLKAPVDALRANLRRYTELQATQRRRVQEIGALQAGEEDMASRAGQIASRIQAILAQGSVDSIDAFRLACQNCRRLLDLRAKESSRAREFGRLLGSLTFEQWRERLAELQDMRGGADEGSAPAVGAQNRLSYLPYLPTVEEAEQQEKRVASQLAEKREQYARVVERVRQAFHNYRTPSEIEEDLAAAERTVQELTLNRKAIALALDSIRNLARLQQEVCAPQLNRAVDERFLQICPDRYEEVKIDPDFRIQVREKGTPELRPAESLSRGTQDQLYFAVRFAVLELLGNSQEPSPCLLDEPFVAYDYERIKAAFRILEQEARQRQLMLFTCREDVRALALQHGAHLVSF